MKRTEAREAAFLLLFEQTFTQDIPFDIMQERALLCRETDADDYTRTLFDGVLQNEKTLDDIINTYSTRWKTSRLTRVTLIALRICVYEIEQNGKADAAVYINEALELIKRYDSPESAKYANGVLGSYVGA